MIYDTIYKRLVKLIDLEKLITEGHLKYKAGAFMDLNLDYLGEGSSKESFKISMSHNYVQNGDVMADPDIEIEIYPTLCEGQAEALTYQQDGLGIYQQVYEYDDKGKKTMVSPKLKKELNSFLNMWLNNIRNQGFKLAS